MTESGRSRPPAPCAVRRGWPTTAGGSCGAPASPDRQADERTDRQINRESETTTQKGGNSAENFGEFETGLGQSEKLTVCVGKGNRSKKETKRTHTKCLGARWVQGEHTRQRKMLTQTQHSLHFYSHTQTRTHLQPQQCTTQRKKKRTRVQMWPLVWYALGVRAPCTNCSAC